MLLFLGIYLAAVVASQWFTRGGAGDASQAEHAVRWTNREIEIPAMGDEGAIEGGGVVRLAYRVGRPDSPRSETPLVLLHGSPGSGDNFDALVEDLADLGIATITPDLPGFGASDRLVPSYSIRAHAHAVEALLAAEGVERAHVLGWSQGGGVALHLAELDPDSIASLTLLGSIGLQRTEGSGSYFFEHAKYALGYAVLVVGAEAVPHFGLLGPWDLRHSFVRNFWDTDQRRLGPIMARTQVPTMIYQGNRDFLVPAWVAEAHHRAMESSRLVMVDGTHFVPFIARERTELLEHLVPFVMRHAEPGVAPMTDSLWLGEPPGSMLGAPGDWMARQLHRMPWWIEVVVVVVLSRIAPWTMLVMLGLIVAGGDLDIGVAVVGLVVARAMRRPGVRPLRIAVDIPVVFFLLVVSVLVTSLVIPPVHGVVGPIAVVVLVPVLGAVGWALSLLPTSAGRVQLVRSISRGMQHEFWPQWAYYGPVVLVLPYLSVRYGGFRTFTCMNTGIEVGGGLAGESKSRILRGFREGDGRILAHALLEPDSDSARRARVARETIAERPDLGGYPLIAKPNEGQNGRDVTLIESEEALKKYIESHSYRIVLQQFHAGPEECGIAWARRPASGSDEESGFIFSVTRKLFPEVEGDGRRSLRALIRADRRFRCQEPVFERRFGERMEEVPPEGTRVSLGRTGNHVLGARFEDGVDLITSELEREIDQLARSFRAVDTDGEGGGVLDYGRFDVRYESDEALREGRGFAIIEFNGTSAESSNFYDPNHSIFWAWSVLLRQWQLMYALGARRRSMGARPMFWRDMLTLAWRHFF